jgi:hypothetical protein
MGSDAGAGASSSSIGSASRPRKSFTGDTVPVGSESTLINPHLQSSNESGPEEKKGLLGRLKDKMREKKDEKERNKSPPASQERMSMILPGRGKSIDVPREQNPEKLVEQPPLPQQEQPQR